MKKPILSFTLKAGKDLQYQYFSGSGSGGQHRNKHQNCVRLSHPDSGTVVQATEEKSRKQNEKVALKRLIENKKFKLWLKLECGVKLDGYANVEKKIDELMKENNLSIEIFKDGNWKKEVKK